MIEKLARFPAVLPETFDRLSQAWSAEGYILETLQLEQAEMRYRGKVFGQIRVDVDTYCFAAEGSTYVQLVVTPERRLSGASASVMLMVDDEMFRQKINEIMDGVLDRAGDYEVVSREDVQSEGILIRDFEHDQKPVRRKNRWGIVVMGVFFMVMGSLLSYLNLSLRINFGTASFWSFTAIGGVLAFCIGIYSIIWKRR